MKVLQINNLNKQYGNIKALNNLNLEIEAGSIFGILGPNGSGKTTTLGIILGIISKDSGSFTWFEDAQTNNHRKRIGAILETPNFYPYLNAEENLKIISQIKGVKDQDYDEILHTVNLYERRNSKFRSYSLGMKQRLAIGATLIGNPDVIIFDEPTNGLDPEGIAEVRNILKEVASGGKTVILASHMLDEVEKVCTHVAIIKKGNLLAVGKVGSIISSNKFIEIGATEMDKLKATITEMPAFVKVQKDKDVYECEVLKSVEISTISKALFEKGLVITHLVERNISLEQEFLQIINHTDNSIKTDSENVLKS